MIQEKPFFFARVFSDTNIYKVYISKNDSFKYGAEVIIKTEFGLDLAVITSFKITPPSKSDSYLTGKLIRYATQDDIKTKNKLIIKSNQLKPNIHLLAEHYKLELNITNVLIPLSESSICIYYTAEKRVDFRYLLIELKRVFKTKIVMRQINNQQRKNSFYLDPRVKL